MRQKKTIVVLGIAIILGLTALGGISTQYFSPISTSAQQPQGNVFEVINQKAKENAANPSFSKSEEIAGLLIENLLVLDIPAYSQTSVKQQVANAHLNGLSGIDENSIVSAVNNLADASVSPDYAYTNPEQIKVVRTFLNRLMPDLVSPSGNMSDLEAFAVYIATVSQKVDNDAFMVTPAEFTASMAAPTTQPFPGSSEAEASNIPEASQETVKTIEMLSVIEDYVGSKNMLAPTDFVSMAGIQ
jgi:hypothetical protein